MKICQNCDTQAIGGYCHKCGQQTNITRLNFVDFFRELMDTLWGLDHGLFFTLKRLVYSPKEAIRGYLAGKRKAMIKPLQYLVIVSAFALAVSHGVHYLFKDHSALAKKTEKKLAPASLENESTLYQMGARFSKIGTQNLGLLLLGFVPFGALFSFWFFKKANLNYWEHLVVNVYIVAQLNIVIVFFTLLQLFRWTGSDFWKHFFAVQRDLDLALIAIMGIMSLYLFRLFPEYGSFPRSIRALGAPFFSAISFFLMGLLIEYLV